MTFRKTFSKLANTGEGNQDRAEKRNLVVVQLHSCFQLFVTPWTTTLQASLSFTISQNLLKLCPLSRWCHPIISSSVILFSSCLLSFPASGSNELVIHIRWQKSIGSSVLASGLQMNIQGYFSLGLISLTSLQSQGLSRVFFNTTVQSHQFFRTLPSLWSNSHIYTCLLKTPSVSSVSSVAQSCLTPCDPMNCSTPGFPIHHQLPEFTKTS